MTDEFDKEAERKRLREKYEAEREDREATERMSELLLQGATMTNKHCDTCGSPIFRYQGQEFCPTCQARIGEEAKAAQAAAEGEQEAGKSAETGAAPADQTAAATEAAEAEAARGDETAAGTGAAAEQRGAREAQQPAPPDEPAPAGTPEAARRESEPQPIAAPAEAGVAPAEAESTAEAREALVSAVATLARRAERTDDPRRARDLLSAAREAAEALAALRGN
jgi:uncharacterized Zn finger protein (UPF0148 family)